MNSIKITHLQENKEINKSKTIQNCKIAENPQPSFSFTNKEK